MTEQVYIVDDDESIVDALQLSLDIEGYKTSTFRSGIEFLAYLKELGGSIYAPGVIILDINMPGMDGLSVHEELIALDCAFSIVFLTGHGDVPMAVDSLKKGAFDFLQKPVKRDILNNIITLALAHSQKKADEMLMKRRFDSLTEKEQAILYLIADGVQSKNIADNLCLSLRSIEVYRSKIFKKMHASHLAELISIVTKLKDYSS